MLCMYWYGIFHSRECRAWEPFPHNSKAFSWICDSLKWEDSIEIILIIALKSRTCTLDIVGLREWIREMHFAQTREKRMRGVAVPTGSTGPHLTESPSPHRFQLHEVGSRILTHWQPPGPQLRQGPLADMGGMVVPPETFIFPDSHHLKHSLPDLGRFGACTEPFNPSCHPCPASAQQVWLSSIATALLSPLNVPDQPSEAIVGQAFKVRKTSCTESGQGLDSNQALSSSQELYHRFWACDTYLDTALCDGGHGFGQDL